MRQANRRRRFSCSRLLHLEERVAPAITVTTAADNGDNLDPIPGSLRAAIIQANDKSGADVIEFNLPGAGLTLAPLAGGYPAIVYPVTIDGTTQPGFLPEGKPIVEVTGTSAGASTGFTFSLSAAGSTVRGLIINGFFYEGLSMLGGDYVVENNYIGTDRTGMTKVPNDSGILLELAENCVIRSNVISGNMDGGVQITGTATGNNTIEGNFFGTNATGTAAIESFGFGLKIAGPNNVVGGPTVDQRNVVGGHSGGGVAIEGQANTVQGNYLGLNAAGTAGFDGSGGLAVFGAKNVVADNVAASVVITGDENTITGNLIGTNAAGSAALTPAGSGLQINGAKNIIGGTSATLRNVISGNGGSGLGISDGAGNNKVIGNFIGVDATGTKAVPNSQGIGIHNSPSNLIEGNVISGNLGTGLVADFLDTPAAFANTIKGNVISDNGGDGLFLLTVKNHTISDNTVGGNGGSGIKIGFNFPYGGNKIVNNVVDANGANGIEILGSASTTIMGNVVSNNKANGVLLAGGTFSNIIQGNFIGTDKAGGAKRGNAAAGIVVNASKGNSIGGTGEGAGNLISANSEYGIAIKGASSATVVLGNRIGTDLFGALDFGNGFSGIDISGATNITIGGAATGARNLISGNTGSGIAIGGGSESITVQGNYIGTAADGTSKLGNEAYGVYVWGVSSKNKIGGPNAGEGNTIAFNGSLYDEQGHGVEIQSGTGNEIRRNSIFKNAGRGIDLGYDSFTLNDAPTFAAPNDGDPDTGANDLQDFPVAIGRAAGDPATGVITWKLNSKADTLYIIDFFANTELDKSGFGEGAEYLDSVTIKTEGDGNKIFTSSHPGKLLISCTATDPDGNTSEFSMVDTDCDGLADAWETTGIDIDENGTPDLVLTTKADHRDLFVEVDIMQGIYVQAKIANALAMVVEAFGKAPDSSMHNPDQTEGITLHAALDATSDTDIGNDSFGLNHWDKFHDIKEGTAGTGRDGKFGSAADRLPANTNWPNICAARRLVYRYGMFASDFDMMMGGNVTTGWSGLGELGGNDFMVTLGTGWDTANLTERDLAGTFMHELGHTLGLDHGGGDDDNRKPNYHSVMSYNWQIPTNMYRRLSAADDVLFGNSLSLDYSRQAFDALNENNMLNESAGVTAPGGLLAIYAGKYGPFGTLADIQAGRAQLAKYATATNWNQTGTDVQNPVGADINFDGVMTELKGHEDWSALQYYFTESPAAAPGESPPADPDADYEREVPAPAPRVSQVTINDGSLQRSRVTSVTIDFDDVVTFPTNPADAFQLVRLSDNAAVTLSAVVAHDLHSHVTLTFTGGAVEFGSLADGRYALTILAASVTGAGGALDGNGDKTGGDNYVLASAGAPNPPTNIWRLFGDSDGDNDVDTSDFGAFRSVFGGTSAVFDFDGDGDVDTSDFGAFRGRFGASV